MLKKIARRKFHLYNIFSRVLNVKQLVASILYITKKSQLTCFCFRAPPQFERVELKKRKTVEPISIVFSTFLKEQPTAVCLKFKWKMQVDLEESQNARESLQCL